MPCDVKRLRVHINFNEMFLLLDNFKLDNGFYGRHAKVFYMKPGTKNLPILLKL